MISMSVGFTKDDQTERTKQSSLPRLKVIVRICLMGVAKNVLDNAVNFYGCLHIWTELGNKKNMQIF